MHITGGSGAGKSTLAGRIGARLGLPVHHLDEVARDPVSGRDRTTEERLEMVRSIAASPAWLSEGIHTGWTDLLCERADLIIWLDQVAGGLAVRNVVRRFVGDALTEARRRRGLRRFLSVRSYLRELARLARSVGEIRAFHRAGGRPASGDGGSRSAIAGQLAPFQHKVVHCRTAADVESVVATIEPVEAGEPRDRP